MQRTPDRATGSADVAQGSPWVAWLAMAIIPVICATMVQAQDAPPAKPPIAALPPMQDQGFQPVAPDATQGQALLPPKHAPVGVIKPPVAVDRSIVRPAPPAGVFPTPVVKPPG